MPTLNDLRDALTAREVHAGDLTAVQHYLDQHLGARAARGHRLAPLAAAAAVVSIAVGLAAVASSHAADPHHVSPGLAGSPAGTAAATTTNAPTASTAPTPPPAPADALRWAFTLAPLPGYTFSYADYQADQQNAEVVSTTDKAFNAGITVYTRGAFDPNTGNVDGTPLRGHEVTVNGQPGIFVAGPSSPSLYWTYGANSWASVDVTNPPSTGTVEAAAFQIAQAVRIGASDPVTLPFRVGAVPKSLTIVDIHSDSERPTVIYGTSAASGDYLLVSRWADSPMNAEPLARQTQAATSPGRVLTRTLADGSTLLVVVESAHLADISSAEQQAIADAIDVTPTLSDPSTWLAVTP